MSQEDLRNINLRMSRLKEEKIRKSLEKYTHSEKYSQSGLGSLFAFVGVIFFIKWMFDRLVQVEWLNGLKWIFLRFVNLPFHTFFLSSLIVLLFFIIFTKLGRSNKLISLLFKIFFLLLGFWIVIFSLSALGNDVKNQSVSSIIEGSLEIFINSVLIFSNEREDLSLVNKTMGFLLTITAIWIIFSLISKSLFSLLRKIKFYSIFGDENVFLGLSQRCFFIYLSFYILFSLIGLIYILY